MHLRVCFVAPLPPPYGGIAHWLTLVLGHARAVGWGGWFVVDIAPRWRSVTKRGLVLRVIGGCAQLARDAALLLKVLLTKNVDVIHVTSSGSFSVGRDYLVSWISKAFGTPFVYHVHHGKLPSVVSANSLEWRLARKVMLRAAKVILLDMGSMKAVKASAPGVDAVVVSNCIDHSQLPEPQDLSQGRAVKTVLFLGWVVPTKGVAELLECWSKLRPEEWRLELVGPVDPAYRDHLIRKFPADNVVFVGEVSHDEAMRRMSRCDLFALPSYTEGFPNVVLEAMALARPIIATNVGAIPEMLAGNAGVVVDARSVDSLAGALETAMSDDYFRSVIGVNAKKKAQESYGVDVVFNAYLDVWRTASLQIS